MLSTESTAKRTRERKPSTATVTKVDVERNADILHPQLFARLRSWRSQRAEELGRPVYGVLTQKSLIGITNSLPTSERELLRMPGFGRKTLEIFGQEILAIVSEYKEDMEQR
jgi:superfamily II DNA helicase RecQ